MKLHVIAHGKMGKCPEAELIARYTKRITWPLQITEFVDSTTKSPPKGGITRVVVLDERGTQISSSGFAQILEKWRDAGCKEARFLIGGADGHSAEDRDQADLCIAFGKSTWPHKLARAMLVEQIYRATSIIAGHPYHRDG